jgi:hypothetical protein
VDLFEEIRREYEFGIASISGVARKFGVHRRMVREAIERSIPMRLPAKERPRPTIGPVAEFIDELLEADRRAPRKQRQTAHRIWVRITRERSGYPIVESTVRGYVRQRKRTLGLRVVPEAFVPQQYAWGDEAQVDWYEADVVLVGERITIGSHLERIFAKLHISNRARLAPGQPSRPQSQHRSIRCRPKLTPRSNWANSRLASRTGASAWSVSRQSTVWKMGPWVA